MDCIVYTRPDGDVSIVRPTPEHLAKFATRQAAFDALRVRSVPESALDIRECTEAEIPASRRFRNSWRRIGTGLPNVDLPLARTQRMNEVRTMRMPKLVKSDVDYVRAQEKADVAMQDKLKTYRRALRDLPTTEQPNVDAITTPEGLATWEPSWPVDPVR